MLYANTDDGSSALWVLDGDGVVIDNISYSIAGRAPILAQINEHYGTSFTGWSDNEIGLRIGDTLPNWNAYEKIKGVLWAYEFEPYQWVAGEILNGILYIYTPNNSTNKWVFDQDGVVLANMQYNEPYLQNTIDAVNEHFQTSFINLVDLVNDITYGQALPSWDAYEKIEYVEE